MTSRSKRRRRVILSDDEDDDEVQRIEKFQSETTKNFILDSGDQEVGKVLLISNDQQNNDARNYDDDDYLTWKTGNKKNKRRR